MITLAQVSTPKKLEVHSYPFITQEWVKYNSTLTNSDFPQLYLYKVEILTLSYWTTSQSPPSPSQFIFSWVFLPEKPLLQSKEYVVLCFTSYPRWHDRSRRAVRKALGTLRHYPSSISHLLHFMGLFLSIVTTGLLLHWSFSIRTPYATVSNTLLLLWKTDCIKVSSAPTPLKVIKLILIMSLRMGPLP